MSKFDELVLHRQATPEQIEDAKTIALEINDAWGFPENYKELGQYGKEGYQASIGSPHQWWEDNCQSYKVASEKYSIARHLNTVCLLADTLLADA